MSWSKKEALSSLYQLRPLPQKANCREFSGSVPLPWEKKQTQQISNLPSITQCASGSEECVLNKMLRESMPFSSRMHLEIRKKSKSEEQDAPAGMYPCPGQQPLLWVLTQATGTVGITTPLETSPFLSEWLSLTFLNWKQRWTSPGTDESTGSSGCPALVCFCIIWLQGSAQVAPNSTCLLLRLSSNSSATTQQGSKGRV